MNFEKFFIENRKLLKLNFILLGMLIFFLGTKYFDSKCYAVTQSELDNAGFSISQWSEEVLNYYNLLNTDMLYFVYKSSSSSYKIVVFPDLNYNDVTAFFEMSNNRGYMNFADKIYSIADFNQDTIKFDYDQGLNTYILDYDLSTHTVTKNFVTGSQCSWGFNITSSKSVGGMYMYSLNSISGTAAYDKLVADSIIYTNCENYIIRKYGSNAVWDVYNPARVFDFNKKLEVVDFDSYLNFGTDEIGGDYIALNSALIETNVDSVIFEGDNLINGVTKYTVSTSMNFDLVKVYVNDSSEVKITFKDINSNTLYSFDKQLAENSGEINYADCVIYSSDSEGDYITLDGKLKNTDVSTVNFKGVFRNYDSNNYTASVLMNFNTVKLYADYPESVVITMYDSNRNIVWSNINDVVDYSGSYKFVTYFEYYDTLSTINTTLNKLYFGKARMNFDLVDGKNNSFDIRDLSDDNFSYDFSYRFKYCYSDETMDADYSDWFSVYDMEKNESGYYYLDVVYSNVIGLFVELAINVTDLNTNETVTHSYSTYSFSLLKGARDGLIYWFDGENGHGALDAYNKFNHIASNDVIIYDSGGNSISGVTSGQDVSFDFGFGIGNILDGFTTVIDTIKNGFSALIGSVNSVGTLFSLAFSWLPSPLPELIKVVFAAMVLFAIIRFIRGH